jgi:hypothetical protein
MFVTSAIAVIETPSLDRLMMFTAAVFLGGVVGLELADGEVVGCDESVGDTVGLAEVVGAPVAPQFG